MTLSEMFADIERSRVLLGIVTKSGSVRFTHRDINECRRFLLQNGLVCTLKGWCSPTHSGMIMLDAGNDTWTSVFWKNEI